jgi:catechol 2,3-dioxygenase-like lactoylglutathione lyase family enzyme
VGIHLFAGIAVSNYAAALAWYEKLLGSPPSTFPHETEAVWELAERRLLYIVQRTEGVGRALVTVIVDDLDGLVAGVARRGLEAARCETYSNGVRKVTYADPDGNEISFGGVPS